MLSGNRCCRGLTSSLLVFPPGKNMKYGVLIAAFFSLRKPFLQAAHERVRLDLVLSSWAAVAVCWNSDSELARSRARIDRVRPEDRPVAGRPLSARLSALVGSFGTCRGRGWPSSVALVCQIDNLGDFTAKDAA
jgi:hypothetical protein